MRPNNNYPQITPVPSSGATGQAQISADLFGCAGKTIEPVYPQITQITQIIPAVPVKPLRAFLATDTHRLTQTKAMFGPAARE